MYLGRFVDAGTSDRCSLSVSVDNVCSEPGITAGDDI